MPSLCRDTSGSESLCPKRRSSPSSETRSADTHGDADRYDERGWGRKSIDADVNGLKRTNDTFGHEGAYFVRKYTAA